MRYIDEKSIIHSSELRKRVYAEANKNIVGLSMMCYRKGERREDLYRRVPVEWAHGESIVFSVPNSELFLEVVEGEELVVGVKILVVFAVTAFDLAVVPGRIGLNKLMPNAKVFQRYFKKCFLVGALWIQPVCKLWAIICLDAFNGIGEALDTVLYELRGRIGIMFLKGF